MSRHKLARESLDAEARARLEELIVEHDPLGRLLTWARRTRREQAADRAKSRSKSAATKPCSPHRLGRHNNIRLPAVGTVITRSYQGRELAVRVLVDGFEYEGQRYRSLSAIAKVVTGSHWNGYLFFGITRQEK